MNERYAHHRAVEIKSMESDFTPKKTMLILVIVVGCFAVLWPKVFHPMLLGTTTQHLKPNELDKTNGCCYVLSETDIDTIQIMSELCKSIIREGSFNVTLSGPQIVHICRNEVLKTCGIDIRDVLQEQVRLGQTTKQILDEIRSLNGSLCFKYNFGVQPWRLGVPHVITLRNYTESVRQERPPHPHVRSEMLHPAFRERGRAIPQTKPPPIILEGRPGPIPGMRPTMGGAGHVVPPSKQATGSMSVIMPIYTIGIVIFFTYTLVKIIFKKHPETPDVIYSSMKNNDAVSRYRKEVVREPESCKLVVNAVSALLEEVDQEIEARRLSNMQLQDEHSGNLSNGNLKKDEKPSVKIVGMETSESCESGRKWLPTNTSTVLPSGEMKKDTVAPPQEIYLDRILPAQSRILVSDSETTEETEKNDDDDAAIVLAGKMTLSVISLENDELSDEIGGIIEEAIENIGGEKTPSPSLVNAGARSSSEDSGSTINSVINNGNLNGQNNEDDEIVEIIEEIHSEEEDEPLKLNGNE